MVWSVLAFLVMEPVAYAAHRWGMHGAGWVLHRSHHRPRRGRGEANDWFPVMFAAVTIGAMALGTGVRSVHVLVPVAIGVTVYGAAYAFVHDVYIHRRLGRLPEVAPFEYLRAAHGLHHRDGGEPYGMLLPIVPRARLRESPPATVTTNPSASATSTPKLA